MKTWHRFAYGFTVAASQGILRRRRRCQQHCYGKSHHNFYNWPCPWALHPKVDIKECNTRTYQTWYATATKHRQHGTDNFQRSCKEEAHKSHQPLLAEDWNADFTLSFRKKNKSWLLYKIELHGYTKFCKLLNLSIIQRLGRLNPCLLAFCLLDLLLRLFIIWYGPGNCFHFPRILWPFHLYSFFYFPSQQDTEQTEHVYSPQQCKF